MRKFDFVIFLVFLILMLYAGSTVNPEYTGQLLGVNSTELKERVEIDISIPQAGTSDYQKPLDLSQAINYSGVAISQGALVLDNQSSSGQATYNLSGFDNTLTFRGSESGFLSSSGVKYRLQGQGSFANFNCFETVSVDNKEFIQFEITKSDAKIYHAGYNWLGQEKCGESGGLLSGVPIAGGVVSTVTSVIDVSVTAVSELIGFFTVTAFLLTSEYLFVKLFALGLVVCFVYVLAALLLW